MRLRRTRLSLSLSTLACGLLYLSLSSPALASDPQRYFALRRQQHWDRKLSYTTVQTNAGAYVGRILELRGTVGGYAETADGLTIMLNLPNNLTVTLDIPRAERAVIRETSAPSLRILTRVEEGSSGNVVPMKVLVVAHESLIAAMESQESARLTARREAERKRASVAQPNRSAPTPINWQSARSTSRPSRGGRRRLLSEAEMQALTARYDPYLGARAKPIFPPYLDFIYNHNPRLSSDQAGLIACSLLHFADRYNVDPRLVVAMIVAESNFNPDSTSRVGAMGLGQLMPGTARSLGVRNAYDPVQNLQGSINYLRSRLDTYRDRALPDGGLSFEQVILSLAAYNAGANAVKKYGGVPPYRETQGYVRRVMNLYQQLCQY